MLDYHKCYYDGLADQSLVLGCSKALAQGGVHIAPSVAQDINT